MRIILNFLLKLNIYNRLHKYIGFKIFKYFKIFFVESNLKELPLLNHPINANFENELEKFKKINSSNVRPFLSYSHILDLIRVSEKFKKKQITFLDYGAGNLELFGYLSKNLKSIKYFYHDQKDYNLIAEKIKKREKIKNLEIIKDFKKNSYSFDFVYFGGSLQYIYNYKDSLKKILKKSKFLVISQTPFHFDKQLKDEIILKQINLSNNLNYLYLINYYRITRFINKYGFKLISLTNNRVIKFINFKNLKKYKNIDMYDLLFEKK